MRIRRSEAAPLQRISLHALCAIAAHRRYNFQRLRALLARDIEVGDEANRLRTDTVSQNAALTQPLRQLAPKSCPCR